MQKRFYSKEYSISIQFMENGTLLGLFAPRDLPTNQFNGIYSIIDNNEASISFFVDWKLEEERGLAFTAFSGAVKMNCEVESLFLKWLLVIENHKGENIEEVQSSSILTSDIESLNLGLNDLEIPFPIDVYSS
jgi:hypothetical protein